MIEVLLNKRYDFEESDNSHILVIIVVSRILSFAIYVLVCLLFHRHTRSLSLSLSWNNYEEETHKQENKSEFDDTTYQ